MGTLAPVVAAVISCAEYVPPTETCHEFPEPLLIVPRLTLVEERTVIPIASDGEPVVVSVVPVQDAFPNTIGRVSLKLALPQVADPPNQKRVLVTVSGINENCIRFINVALPEIDAVTALEIPGVDCVFS